MSNIERMGGAPKHWLGSLISSLIMSFDAFYFWLRWFYSYSFFWFVLLGVLGRGYSQIVSFSWHNYHVPWTQAASTAFRFSSFSESQTFLYLLQTLSLEDVAMWKTSCILIDGLETTNYGWDIHPKHHGDQIFKDAKHTFPWQDFTSQRTQSVQTKNILHFDSHIHFPHVWSRDNALLLSTPG